MANKTKELAIMPKRVLELLACLDEAEIFLAKAQDLFDDWWKGIIEVREPKPEDLNEWYVRYASLMKIVEIRMRVEQELLEEITPFLKEKGCEASFSTGPLFKSSPKRSLSKSSLKDVFFAPPPEGVN